MLNLIKKYIPRSLFSLYHLTLAWAGTVLYLSPSKKVFLIGVTGTKGKTTTAYFIYQLLQKNGFESALTSTTFFALGDKVEINRTKMGMPGRLFLSRWLKRASRQNIRYAVLETTSEGIAQHRQRFLDYNLVVFTSLSPEHIERHGSFIGYRKAKEKLFEQCKETHVLNLNDKHVEHFMKYPAKQKWGVSLDKKISNTQLTNILEGETSGQNKLMIKEWKYANGNKKLSSKATVVLPFPGKFNAMNLLLALGATRATKIPFSKATATISKLALPPGRMQEITDLGVPYKIFLDYAHEPLSLRSALESCKDLLPKNKKLICLTGAQGGGRDKWKRKVLGRIAADYCDYVIVATEDPYNDNPETINKEVIQGSLSHSNFKENMNCWQYTNRQDGIKKALELAKAGDIVIISGKGGEKLMCVGNKKIPWDEEEEVRNAITNLE